MLDKRALSAARVADDAEQLALGNVEVYVVDGDLFKWSALTVKPA